MPDPDRSARLSLPYLQQGQAQKHVTHNEALARLDLLVQMTVQAFGATVPPALPDEGQVWELGAGATGVWSGRPPGTLAAWLAGDWDYLSPQPGWQATRGTDLRLWDGSAWRQPGMDNLPGLGINASHDTVNRLVVAGAATLLTHAGAGHQLKLNKAAAGDTASLLFQTGWTGHAEMGTAGNDDFTVKVSPDGGTWRTALGIARATGAVSLNHGLAVTGTITGTAVTQSPADSTAGRLMATGNAGLLLTGNSGTTYADLNAATVSGTWGYANTAANRPAAPGSGFSNTVEVIRDSAGGRIFQISRQCGGTTAQGFEYHRVYDGTTWSAWYLVWSQRNTTVDSNGFLKAASPIVRLFDDRIEEPVQPTGAVMTRLSQGVFTLAGTAGLAQKGWQIEVPKDHNGNRLVHVATDWDDDRSGNGPGDGSGGLLTITLTRPVWQDGLWIAGAPMDVPEGRWIDFRLHEVTAAPDQESDPDAGA